VVGWAEADSGAAEMAAAAPGWIAFSTVVAEDGPSENRKVRHRAYAPLAVLGVLGVVQYIFHSITHLCQSVALATSDGIRAAHGHGTYASRIPQKMATLTNASALSLCPASETRSSAL